MAKHSVKIPQAIRTPSDIHTHVLSDIRTHVFFLSGSLQVFKCSQKYVTIQGPLARMASMFLSSLLLIAAFQSAAAGMFVFTFRFQLV